MVTHDPRSTLARQRREEKRARMLRKLGGELRYYRISHQRVADACRPPVDRSLVSRVLSNTAKSDTNVLPTAKRLVAEAKKAEAEREAVA